MSPFAPHIAEELWIIAGFDGLCCEQEWPKYNSKFAKEKKINLIIQINGKVRDKIQVEGGISQQKAKSFASKSEKAQKYLDGKKIKKNEVKINEIQ